ncbi:hydantoinase/oxoprolinase family protein [Candidatus Bathyarchaeota archaeon]|nr:MAG: hydantoinase/oxoprolinase family protein [Candidatus Bathyarchaeota archaeon]
MRVGIDIGGAFTDLVAYDDSTKELKWVKVESTPRDLSAGVIECVKRSGIPPLEIGQIIHGQTVVINAIIERKGVKVGLITTKGHRDVLGLQRANRRDMYNFRYKKPEPLVPRCLRLEIDERVMADGTVLKELEEEEVVEAAERLLKEGVEALCIAFLNSYANPDNERRAGEIVRGMTTVPLVLSHEVTREWREYERFSTATLNAYVLPILDRYLGRLQDALSNGGTTFMAMVSNGGMVPFEYARKFPIYTIESGPIAGVIGAIGVASIIGEKNIIALDGGSTTTKASLVEGLTPEVTTEYYVERDRFRPGYPVMVPVIRTVEVGNGGTSIAWIDPVGRVKVGPKAAGADPGPACYGRGGEDPTLTDAYVVTGLLNPKYLLGGELLIHRDLAVRAVKKIADWLNVSVEEAAEGIIKLANDNAAYAISLVSIQRGYDPRDFTLIAYGGSGPMFAPFIAEELEIRRIVIPSIPPGVFSAWGMLNTDIVHSTIQTYITRLDSPDAVETMNRVYGELEEEILEVFKSEGIEGPIILERYADMRYYGQEHTVRVPVKSGGLSREDVDATIEGFHEAHEREYEFKLVGDPVEIVNFQVIGVKKVRKLELSELPEDELDPEEAFLAERSVYINGGYETLPVYDRTKLGRGATIRGPAILEDPTATIIVLHAQEAVVDRYGNIIIGRVR